MRSHAGAQHLGRPQRGRALEREHLPEAHRGGAAHMEPTLPGPAAGRARRWARPAAVPGRSAIAWTNPIAAGDSSELICAIRPSASTTRRTDASSAHCSTMACADCASTTACGCRPREQRAAEVVALEPDLAQLAVSRRVLGQRAQFLHQRVVARGDDFRAHVEGGERRGVEGVDCQAGTLGPATGAKLRRCSGQGPCRAAPAGARACRSPCGV